MPNAKFISATAWTAALEIDVVDGENLFPQLQAGTYRPVLSGVASVVIPQLSAGTIAEASPTIGDTLTVTGSNATGTATFNWQVGAADLDPVVTTATLPTTGLAAGDYRRGVADGVQTVVYTPAVTVGAAATAPAAFVDANWSVATGATTGGQLDVTIATLPAANGATITDIEYDLGASGTWISSGGTVGFTITGLTAATSFAVRLRAVNAAGNGLPGNSESATSSAAASGPTVILSDDFSTNTRANYVAVGGTTDWEISGGLARIVGLSGSLTTIRPITPPVLATDYFVRIIIGAIGTGLDQFLIRAKLDVNWGSTWNSVSVRSVAQGGLLELREGNKNPIAILGVNLVVGDVLELRITNNMNNATVLVNGIAPSAAFENLDVSETPNSTRVSFGMSNARQVSQFEAGNL